MNSYVPFKLFMGLVQISLKPLKFQFCPIFISNFPKEGCGQGEPGLMRWKITFYQLNTQI